MSPSNFLASIGEIVLFSTRLSPIPNLNVLFTIGSKKSAQLVVNDTYDIIFSVLKSLSFAGVSKN